MYISRSLLPAAVGCIIIAAALLVPTTHAFLPPTGSLNNGGGGGGPPVAKQKKRARVLLLLRATKKYPILAREEDIMNPKAHGTSAKPVRNDLLWGVDFETADRICNFNRRYAERKGYSTNFLNFLAGRMDKNKSKDNNNAVTQKFYDSVTGNLLFTAPIGRTLEEFIEESKRHGWPSFRDREVNWECVRCLEGQRHGGECVSVTGTHLGHNIPDEKGNRYCINLVSIAGRSGGLPPGYPPY